MKKYILTLGIILSALGFASADNYCDVIRYGELYASDGTYLGVLTNNYNDPESIANSFGKYGSEFQTKSIFNEFGTYGSEFQTKSPRNEFATATSVPRIYKGDGYRYLSINEFIPSSLNTFDVVTCFISPFDERLKPFKDLDNNRLLYIQEKSCQSEFGTNSTVGDDRGKCKCKIGYKRNQQGTSCVPMSEDEKCIFEFGDYAYSPEPGYCNCIAGYEWNYNKTSCKKSATNYSNITYYPIVDTTTVTTVDCSGYGPNAVATSNGQCTCKTDFEWNYNKNWCVADRNNKLYGGKDFRSAKDGGDYINMLLDYEGEIEEKAKAGNSTPTSFEKTYKSKSDELKDAIQWMYDNGLTMWNTLPEFLPYDNITREQASKFFVEFAAKVLGKNRGVVYNYDIFSDIKNADPTLKDYIIYANNMGLFKGNNGKYMPFNNLTKAQAIAVLIRLVDGMLDESSTIPYYDVNGDFSEHYGWYTQYLGHATFYKIDKRRITSNIDKLDSDNITRGDLAILLYEMAMYLSNPDNAKL